MMQPLKTRQLSCYLGNGCFGNSSVWPRVALWCAYMKFFHYIPRFMNPYTIIEKHKCLQMLTQCSVVYKTNGQSLWRHCWYKYDVIVGIGITSLPVNAQSCSQDKNMESMCIKIYSAMRMPEKFELVSRIYATFVQWPVEFSPPCWRLKVLYFKSIIFLGGKSLSLGNKIDYFCSKKILIKSWERGALKSKWRFVYRSSTVADL